MYTKPFKQFQFQMEIRLLPIINPLLSTVRLICCVSLHYNTSERITSLLVKVSQSLSYIHNGLE